MILVKPGYDYLQSYVFAIQRGWLPDHHREDSGRSVLRLIDASPEGFFERFDDPHALGGPAQMPDGSFVPRLPSIGRWMWDGEFCGSINLRWQNGTPALPEYCLGHIGYSVVPWKQRMGYATAALAQLLPHARSLGLPFVELTTDAGNEASQRVIYANGGVLIERFHKLPQHGGGPALRFRIAL